MNSAELSQAKLVIKAALKEDIEDGEDVTAASTIPKGSIAHAQFIAKQSGIVCGIAVASLVFEIVANEEKRPNVNLHWSVNDGDFVTTGKQLGTVQGDSHVVLRAERVALNLLQRLSGVASATRDLTNAVRPHKSVILDTRKTVPGFRYLDKYAVRCGGGKNHRMGLWDMILIKDNHVDVAGGVSNALRAAHSYLERKGLLDKVQVEIEVRSIDELSQALEALHKFSTRVKLDRIMLDNFAKKTEGGKTVDTSLLSKAVQLVGGRVPLEASGNVTLASVNQIAATGVDFISTGSMHHSVKAFDISMKILKIDVRSKL